MPQETEHTQIPNEIVSPLPVKELREILIPDVLQALLEQEQKGALVIRRYEQLSARMLEWILQAEKNEIKKRDLLHVSSPMAEYMKLRYISSASLELFKTWHESCNAIPVEEFVTTATGLICHGEKYI